MISIKNVNHDFDKRCVLDNISLEISDKRTAIIGANGSGKSTFLRLLNGLVIPNKGSVTINQLSTSSQIKSVRKEVGFVFQNPDNQIVYPIVSEDIAFGLKNSGMSKDEIEKQVSNILDCYQLSHLANRYTHELSGGEKQMIAICGVLVMKPNIIAFDEPTTLLDLRHKQRIEHMITQLPHYAVVVTHDLQWAATFDRVICFDNGKIAYDGEPNDVIENYQSLMLTSSGQSSL